MSAQGDYLRAQLGTVTTFNQMLTVSADAADVAAGEEPATEGAAADETGDDDETNDEDEILPLVRSPASSRQPRKPAVTTRRRKARRRY